MKRSMNVGENYFFFFFSKIRTMKNENKQECRLVLFFSFFFLNFFNNLFKKKKNEKKHQYSYYFFSFFFLNFLEIRKMKRSMNAGLYYFSFFFLFFLNKKNDKWKEAWMPACTMPLRPLPDWNSSQLSECETRAIYLEAEGRAKTGRETHLQTDTDTRISGAIKFFCLMFFFVF